MNFNITIVQVEQTTRQGPKSAYQQLDVAFKNHQSGKLESKKIMSFNEAAYKGLVNAKQGDTFEVDSQKNEKTGYWDWVKVYQAAPGAIGEPAPKAQVAFTPQVRNTYETPEERAKKQVFIIKQSSLSTATAALSVGAKVPPKAEEVIAYAQSLTDWVFQVVQPAQIQAQTLTDETDDIPY